jgi:metal-responsive CopG/Arc/MetJ family transcriptional regulator
MGGLFSSNKNKIMSLDSLNENLVSSYSNGNGNININNLIEPLIFEINKLKEDNQKIIVDIKFLYDKNKKLENEINKMQHNYGKEIFTLNEGYSSLQKDIETLLNNQKIISDVLQKNS